MGSSPFFSVRVKQNEEHHDSYAIHALQELIIEQRAVCSQKLRPIFSSGLRCHQSCTGIHLCRYRVLQMERSGGYFQVPI